MSNEKPKEIKQHQIVVGAFGTLPESMGIVERVDQPEEGGIFTKYIGCNYLFKGYPDGDKVLAIGIPKTLLSMTWRYFWQVLPVRLMLFAAGSVFLLFPKRMKKEAMATTALAYIKISSRALENRVIPEKKFCVAVKEIYRVFELKRKERKGQKEGIIRKIRNVLCMILEYDYPYRAILQDTLPLIDKEALRKNPVKELKRLLGIISKRQREEQVKKYWKTIGTFIGIMFFLDKDLKEWTVDFFLNLDMEKIKLDEADWYYCLERDNYDFKGMGFTNRMGERMVLDNKVGNKRPKIILKQPEKNNGTSKASKPETQQSNAG